MASKVTVALAGATGNLGKPILSALLAAGHPVTVLTRKGSKSTASLSHTANVTIEEVDYTSVSSLTSALQKTQVQAVVSCLATASASEQHPLIEASLASGTVTRFIPSEFGVDTTNPLTEKLPIMAGKVATREYLVSKCDNPDASMSYTLIMTGPFFDWGLQVGFLLNPAKHSATLFDGGDRRFSTTSLPTIGKTVVAVLANQSQTKNRVVRVYDVVTTQKELIDVAKKIDGKEWDVQHAKTEELERASYEELKKGDGKDMGKMVMGFLFRGIFGDGYSGNIDGQEDNEMLGLPKMSAEQVKEVVRASLSA